MKYGFVINGKLPSLNEYINACRCNRYKGAQLKRDVEAFISCSIKQAKLKPIYNPCTVRFEWHEKTAKRDCDNIASAKKYILDALQKTGIIPNDNQKYIKGFTDDFVRDVKDFVIVELTELKNQEMTIEIPKEKKK